MRDLLRDIARIVPLCFCTGAGIEFFMIKTGFYQIVTKKEAERQAQRLLQEQERRERIKRLGIPSLEPPSN